MALETVLRSVPIGLTDPLAYYPPEPEPGCSTCARFQRQIERATDPRCDEFDPSRASDLRVEMARHKADGAAS